MAGSNPDTQESHVRSGGGTVYRTRAHFDSSIERTLAIFPINSDHSSLWRGITKVEIERWRPIIKAANLKAE
jgi:hypothetical protein